MSDIQGTLAAVRATIASIRALDWALEEVSLDAAGTKATIAFDNCAALVHLYTIEASIFRAMGLPDEAKTSLEHASEEATDGGPN